MYEMKKKLKEVTFCLGDEPIKALLWCDKTPRGKRTKPVKLNGVIIGAHREYQPM
jgi:hypothetical protein